MVRESSRRGIDTQRDRTLPGTRGGKGKWAPSTFNHYRSLMSLSYRLGILNRKVTSNPARSVTHRREDNKRVRFLTEEEGNKLRKVIEAKWSLHLAELDLGIHTGLRKGSQYSLTWDMVDFSGRMLNIPRTKNEEPIHVPLNDAAVAALRVVHDGAMAEGVCSSRPRPANRSKTGDTGLTTRCWRRDLELSLARLAAHVCEPAAHEGRAARRHSGSFGAQEFNDDEAIRASGAEQAACGGVSLELNCHHNSHRRIRLSGDHLASCCDIKSLGA
jgi:integrase